MKVTRGDSLPRFRNRCPFLWDTVPAGPHDTRRSADGALTPARLCDTVILGLLHAGAHLPPEAGSDGRATTETALQINDTLSMTSEPS